MTDFNLAYFHSYLSLHNLNGKNVSALTDYLYYGFMPGSFYTHFFSNASLTDVIGRMDNSHDLEQWVSILRLINSLRYAKEFFGSYDAVVNWVNKDSEQRRELLIKMGLQIHAEQAMYHILKGDTAHDVAYQKIFGSGK